MKEQYDYNRYRIINQARQILNYSSNTYFDKNNLVDVVRIFNNILLNKSDEFTRSLNNTMEILKNEGIQQKFIASLENNNNSSFVILPMFSLNHAFYGVLRKINNEYSFTIVNRGDRGTYKQYEEFVIEDGKLPQFIAFLKRVERQDSKIKTQDIYIGFSEFSTKHYSLNVVSLPQKVGNCFIKELEAAIKYAFSTRNETKINVLNLRDNTKPKFTPKWDLETFEIHDRYIKSLEQENVELAPMLEDIYRMYFTNKLIRKNTNDDTISMEVLNRIFYENDDVVGSFLRSVDMYNFNKLKVQIEAIVDNYTTEDVKQDYLVIKDAYSKLKDRYTYKWYDEEGLDKASENFTNIASQLKEEYINMYYNEALSLYGRLEYDESEKLLNKIIQVSPDYAYAYRLRALVNWDNYDRTNVIKDIDKAIAIQPFECSNYVHKAKFLKLLGDFDGYVDTCNKWFELAPTNKEVCVEVYNECYIRGKFKQALEWVERARKIDDRDRKLIGMENKVREKIKSNDRSIF